MEQEKDDMEVEDERLEENADEEQHDGSASSSTGNDVEDSASSRDDTS